MSEGANALVQLARQEIADWHGLPRGLTLADIRAHFEPVGPGVGRARLGRREVTFVYASGSHYLEPVRIWLDGEDVLAVDVRAPELATRLPELREALGAPEAELDYRLGTLPVTGGECVYASRGLTHFVNTDHTRLMHLAFYPSTTEDEYDAAFRIHLGERLFPSG